MKKPLEPRRGRRLTVPLVGCPCPKRRHRYRYRHRNRKRFGEFVSNSNSDSNSDCPLSKQPPKHMDPGRRCPHRPEEGFETAPGTLPPRSSCRLPLPHASVSVSASESKTNRSMRFELELELGLELAHLGTASKGHGLRAATHSSPSVIAWPHRRRTRSHASGIPASRRDGSR
jgi:hypothetical protein